MEGSLSLIVMRGSSTKTPVERMTTVRLPRPVARGMPTDAASSAPRASDIGNRHPTSIALPPAKGAVPQHVPKSPDQLSALAAAMPLPASRIPSNFHVRDATGRLVFPSQRPSGDADAAMLSETLTRMLEEWQKRSSPPF